MNWLIKELIGETPKPEPKLAKLPWIDDENRDFTRPLVTKTERERADKRIEGIVRNEQMRELLGGDYYEKATAADAFAGVTDIGPLVADLDNRSYEDSTQATKCLCKCRQCALVGDCSKCSAETKCKFFVAAESVKASFIRELKKVTSPKKSRRSAVDEMLEKHYGFEALVGQFRRAV
ncbi:MAG: hypothetical protein WBP73_03650 [Terriglobales bacterium]